MLHIIYFAPLYPFYNMMPHFAGKDNPFFPYILLPYCNIIFY